MANDLFRNIKGFLSGLAAHCWLLSLNLEISKNLVDAQLYNANKQIAAVEFWSQLTPQKCSAYIDHLVNKVQFKNSRNTVYN